MIINPISGGGGGQPTAETDPIWQSEKGNYYTKDEANSKFVEKPFDPSEGATANTFVYLTFNDGTAPRYDYYSTGTITNSAYSVNTAVETVYFGNGITKIGSSAFASCQSLTSVTIPDSVTSIGDNAFYRCSSVTEVIIGSGVRSVGRGVFQACTSLTSVTIPNSVTSIGYGAFQDCSNITNIVIPNSVTSIDWYAFSNCPKLNEIKVYGTTASGIERDTFSNVAKVGTLYHPKGSDYSTWKSNSYLSGWTFVEFDTRDIEERVDDLDERVTVLEEGGGGGTASALHYESDEIDDGEGNTYREMLDINKEVGIHFHLSNDEADMPSTHIGNGSVEVTNSVTKMLMSTDEGFMGGYTMSEYGEPYRGVILQTDGTFNLFVDDATTNKSFVYLMNEDGININGNPQPIMQVLTQAEYDALTEKDDSILYIIKG